jgi:hypothetical protein
MRGIQTGFNDALDLRFTTNQTFGNSTQVDRMTIKPFNGRVGIGTTTPQQLLDVRGNVNFNSGTGTTATRLILGPAPSTGNLDYCSIVQSAPNTASNFGSTLSFWTHNASPSAAEPIQRMTIDSAGNVGIGAVATGTIPNKLHVDVNTRSGTHGTGLSGYFTKSTSSQTESIAEIRHANGTQGVGFGWNSFNAVGSIASQDLFYNTKGAGTHVFTDSTSGETMRIVSSTDRVGIRTTNPAHTLDVNGVIRGSRTIVFVATGTYNMTATFNALSAASYTDLISLAYTPKQSGTVTLLIEATFETYQTSRQGDDGIRFRIVNAAATELSYAQYYTEIGTSNLSSLSWMSPLRYTGTVTGADTFRLQYQCFNGGVYNTRRGVLTIYEISSTA